MPYDGHVAIEGEPKIKGENYRRQIPIPKYGP
jgi:hypothetical protein